MMPTWAEFMSPSLRVLLDGEIHRTRTIIEDAADLLGITEEQRKILIPSGQEQYRNRGNWALSFLSRVDAVERPMRGQYRITELGRKLLADHPDGITEDDLRSLLEPNDPRDWRASRHRSDEADTVLLESAEQGELDPVEQIDQGIERIHADVSADLLTRLHNQEPEFFEQAVLDLLIAMGFGGTTGKATRTQLVNDGGIDGIVDQDALGLSRIYVQAKRYAPENSVGRPEIQGFVGALHGNQANQGVFITTGRFSKGASGYAQSVPTRVVLIDGARLTTLMIRYGVGVQVKRTVKIVDVDEDFFE